MNVKISYKHLESTPAIDEMTRTKSEKLKKYFKGTMNLDWNFSVEKQSQIAHCHVTGDHVEFFAEATTSSIYTSIDQVVHHLEAQARKNKELVQNHKVPAAI
jgi:putative sigma-54 modulation protein